MKDKNEKIIIDCDSVQLDVAQQKADKLVETLEKANSLLNELARK